MISPRSGLWEKNHGFRWHGRVSKADLSLPGSQKVLPSNHEFIYFVGKNLLYHNDNVPTHKSVTAVFNWYKLSEYPSCSADLAMTVSHFFRIIKSFS